MIWKYMHMHNQTSFIASIPSWFVSSLEFLIYSISYWAFGYRWPFHQALMHTLIGFTLYLKVIQSVMKVIRSMDFGILWWIGAIGRTVEFWMNFDFLQINNWFLNIFAEHACECVVCMYGLGIKVLLAVCINLLFGRINFCACLSFVVRLQLLSVDYCYLFYLY